MVLTRERPNDLTRERPNDLTRERPNSEVPILPERPKALRPTTQ